MAKTVKSFEELSYLLKTGSVPDEQRPKHTGGYNLLYNKTILVWNEPYANCMKAKKEFRMMGSIYKDKNNFRIVEHK